MDSHFNLYIFGTLDISVFMSVTYVAYVLKIDGHIYLT